MRYRYFLIPYYQFVVWLNVEIGALVGPLLRNVRQLIIPLQFEHVGGRRLRSGRAALLLPLGHLATVVVVPLQKVVFLALAKIINPTSHHDHVQCANLGELSGT